MNKKNWYIDTENAYTKNGFSGQKKCRKGNSIHVYYVSFKLPWIFVFFPYFILLLAFILTLCAAILLLYQIPIFFYLHSFCYRLIQSSSRFSSTSFVLHRLTLNIHHRHDFLCGYPEYDFSSIALPIPWPWRLLFFLYNYCSSHAHILYWQFNSIFFSSFWSFLCTIDRRKKIYIVTSFLFVFILCSQIFFLVVTPHLFNHQFFIILNFQPLLLSYLIWKGNNQETWMWKRNSFDFFRVQKIENKIERSKKEKDMKYNWRSTRTILKCLKENDETKHKIEIFQQMS